MLPSGACTAPSSLVRGKLQFFFRTSQAILKIIQQAAVDKSGVRIRKRATIADDLNHQSERLVDIYGRIFHSLGIHGADYEPMLKERSHEEAGSSLPNCPDLINSFIEL